MQSQDLTGTPLPDLGFLIERLMIGLLMPADKCLSVGVEPHADPIQLVPRLPEAAGVAS